MHCPGQPISSPIEEELRALEQAMADGAHDAATLRRYGDATARLEHAGGWDWRDRASSVLRGLGFRDAELDRPLDSFSGGELTRASLARSLAGDPDLLLLDEPTNHLDVQSLEWLERELLGLDAGVILVAHDRWFLEAVTTAVLELGGPRPFFFDGPWHAWRREKAARASAAATTVDRVSDDIERLERFVARFRYKKSKAKQAQAKLTEIARLEKQRRTAADELTALTKRRRTLGFEFLKPARSGRIVLEAERVTVSAGDKQLLHDTTLVLERGEHVALVGPNGSGKTTLLETVLGLREADAGTIRHRSRRDPGLLLAARRRAPRDAAPCSMPRCPPPGCHDRRRRRCSAAFSSPAGRLTRSRCRCSRVASAGAWRSLSSSPPAQTCSCSTSRPTISTSRAASRSRRRWKRFPGTVLLVSHDRAVLDAVPDRIVAVEDHGLRSYDGGWADLVQARAQEKEPPEPAPEKPKKVRRRPQERPRPSELDRVEAQIGELERQVAAMEERLAVDWADMDLLTAHRAARDELQRQLARWEELFAAAQTGVQ